MANGKENEVSDKSKENERQLRIKHKEQLNCQEKSRKKRILSAESASDEVEDQSPNANTTFLPPSIPKKSCCFPSRSQLRLWLLI